MYTLYGHVVSMLFYSVGIQLVTEWRKAYKHHHDYAYDLLFSARSVSARYRKNNTLINNFLKLYTPFSILKFVTGNV